MTWFSILILLLIALCVFYFRPLTKLFLVSKIWDLVVLTIIILITVLEVFSSYVMPYLAYQDTANLPCGPASPQAICYNLKQPLCEEAWASYHDLCKVEMAPEIAARGPTGLVGPIITKCKAKKFDKVFGFNRKNSDSLICRSYFRYLKGE